ncbi:HepT-like ribonuclease domain-containing protein [Clostridium neonatale]|uniref:HepT-like ribonuclease domain-containing protein n=1 Tax=Clostridium neonatale TaxID=137838 RepID=UPI001DFD9A7A|nr:HepT-like ribonuclease domain-containing protein [Clostridium neonatale]CAG9714621.1 DUF86 domain-containing protein [Clostridium neonatale]CAI3613630.1 conserved hypothetical protein [Clostridium neonatale]
MNNERLIKIIEDFKECLNDIDECIDVLDNDNGNKLMIKLAQSSLRQLFVSYHTILEDFCSIALKEIKKYKIGITLQESLVVLKDNNIISDELFTYLDKSRLIRNRISHRYKEPTFEELYNHIKRNKKYLDDIVIVCQRYLIP